jgi:hypothetical protein
VFLRVESTEQRLLGAHATRGVYVPARGIAIIACGSGSFSGGGLGAEIAADVLASELGADAIGEAAIRGAFAAAHRMVCAVTELHWLYRGIGVSAVACRLVDQVLVLGRVGGCRAYLLRAGTSRPLTNDAEHELDTAHGTVWRQALGTELAPTVTFCSGDAIPGDMMVLVADTPPRTVLEPALEAAARQSGAAAALALGAALRDVDHVLLSVEP